MKLLISILVCLTCLSASAQHDDGEPGLEVLIAAADAGNGRAALMVYHRLKDSDLPLASYFSQIAFREFAPGACKALLEMLTLNGSLQKTQPNTRAGAVTLCAAIDWWQANPGSPFELGAYELPHAALALSVLGYWDMEIPRMGAVPAADIQADLQTALREAVEDPNVRIKVRRVLVKITSGLVCDRAKRICRNQGSVTNP